MKIKQQFSKCATILALSATLGQVILAPMPALASMDETTTTTTSDEVLAEESVSSEASEESGEATEGSSVESDFILPEMTVPIVEEKKEEAEVSITDGLKNFSVYTTDGDIIQFTKNMLALRSNIGNSDGQLTKTYGAAQASTPYITISGEENGAVWCIEPDKPFPVNLEYAKSVYQDEGILNILYYAGLNGWDQPNEHYVDVFVALNAYLGHSAAGVPFNSPSFTSDSTVAYLLQKAQDKDAPAGKFDIQNKVQTANFDSSAKLQKTDWYTPVSDSDNTTYDIPTNSFDSDVSVELSDGRVLQAKTGTHTISSQVKFRLVASASYDKQIKFTINTNKRKIAALSFKPAVGDGQTIVKAGMVKDPITVPDVTATFKAQLGKVKVAKTDQVTGNFIPGVVFDVIVPEKTYTVTTGADGTYELPEEFEHGTTGQIIEKSVPAGYVLDKTPIDFTIKGGETVTVTQKNNIQKAVGTFEKTAEVYDAEKTKETGLPVYKNIPLEGGEFVIKNANDTTAPDKETVLTPTGEYSDTIVTDAEGKGNSTTAFYNGDQNKYVLDEINEPDNYRQFEPVEFTVPYDVSTLDVATYDFGIFNNELKTGEVHWNKRDGLDLLSPLNIPGAEFLIRGITENSKEVNFVYTSTTATDILKLPFGHYTATEIKYPDNFTLSPEQPATIVFEVVDNAILEINWNNEKLQPGMGTKAFANGGKKEFDPTVDNYFYDTISFENFDSEKDLITHLVGVDSNIVYEAKRDVIAVDEKTGEAIVELFIPKNTVKNFEDVVFKEYAYNQTEDGSLDDSEENLYAKHDDHYDQNQTIYNAGKEPVKAGASTTNSLPNTGEKVLAAFSYAGMLLAGVASYLFFVKNRKKA